MDTSTAILVSAGGIWAGIFVMAWSNWSRGRADKRRAEAEDNRHAEAMKGAADRHAEAMAAHKEAMAALSVLIERSAPHSGPARPG